MRMLMTLPTLFWQVTVDKRLKELTRLMRLSNRDSSGELVRRAKRAKRAKRARFENAKIDDRVIRIEEFLSTNPVSRV